MRIYIYMYNDSINYGYKWNKYDVLVFTYFVSEVENHVIYRGLMKEFFPSNNLAIYKENQSV
jgi:hypothetical protein